MLARVVEKVDDLYHNPNPSDVTGVPSGFVDLDQKTAGMHAGDLLIIAGRPGSGKTGLMLNIAKNAALTYKKHVAVFSLEMGNDQLVQRLISKLLFRLIQLFRDAIQVRKLLTHLMHGKHDSVLPEVAMFLLLTFRFTICQVLAGEQ